MNGNSAARNRVSHQSARQGQRFWSALAVACLLVAWATAPANCQLVKETPSELEGVGIDDRSGERLPLDLEFTNSQNKTVRLGDCFTGDRPVILSLTYSDCPMLCHLQLNGLVDTLRDMKLEPGKQFEIINVSIDPNEKWQRAQATKRKQLEAYDRPGTAAGWHFLVGKNVTKLAEAVGFRYKYVADKDIYVHAAGLMICTPKGQLSRYLDGVMYKPSTMRMALIEAGEGKIGTPMERVLMFCFHYDATEGEYGLAATRLMQLAAGVTLGVLILGLTPYWIRSRRRRHVGQKSADGAEPPGAGPEGASPTDADRE